MRTVVPLALFALAGVLIGGAVSLRRQGVRWAVAGAVGALAVVAAAGGVLWLVPGS